MKYRSGFAVVGRIPRFAQAVVCREPGVRNVTPGWIREHGTPVLRAFVDAMPPDWQQRDYRVRARLVWLKPGWRPGPSRWHCDQIGARADRQIDYVVGAVPGKHTIACVAGDCSLTVFVDDEIELPDIPLGQPQDSIYSALIRARVAAGTLRTRQIEEGALTLFGEGDFHDVSPATHAGWRYFMRATDRGELPRDVPADPYVWSAVRNGYEPQTRSEIALYAPYRAPR